MFVCEGPPGAVGSKASVHMNSKPCSAKPQLGKVMGVVAAHSPGVTGAEVLPGAVARESGNAHVDTSSFLSCGGVS